MQKLKEVFITDGKPCVEGAVAVFEQPIPSKNVKRASLAITALGLYEAEINGRKIGDELFSPGFTYYPKELQYQIYDVTKMLGDCATLRVYLGQGWYCGRFTFDNKTQIYGDVPSVAWILEYEDEEGIHVATSADKNVKIVDSPYEYAGFYDGEIYRGDKANFADSGVTPVPFTGLVPDVLVQRFNAVRMREEITVKSVSVRDDVTILDFGQNFAGIVSIDPSKMKGEVLKLRHGEILNDDGSLYTTNLRKAKAEIVYHKGDDVYTPRFTYMGFRYVELSGVPYADGLITAHAIYSDMERTGEFECANEKVNKLYENQVWGQKSNYVEVPTDCPQRDERMGYTGDGHVFARTGAYNFDTRSFWKKFLADIRYSQLDNKEGYIPSTAPTPSREVQGIGFLSMLGWGNAITLIPEMLYQQYGDFSYMEENYESMEKFVDCECRKMKLFNLWKGPSLGDWLAPGKNMAYMAMHNGPVSNAFIVHDLTVVSELAGYGKPEKQKAYRHQLEKTRKAYIKSYIKKDGSMKDDYQGAYVMALVMVLSPESELYGKVYKKLVGKIRGEGMQTGFFATPHLLPLLCDNGDEKLAFDLLLQPECPGWMYQVDRGATTTWERWDALRPDGTVNETKSGSDNMVSFNHYSFGSVGEFYYRYILGIKPLKPGFEEISIHPYVDERLGRAKGSYKSVAGKISVSWEIKENETVFDIDTPSLTALTLPDGTEYKLEPGAYSFKSGR